MPRPDPIPAPRASTRRRFWRVFRLLALFATIVAAIAALFVARGQSGPRIHMLIATALGTGLIVLVGGALMTLVFMSAASGHDEAAGQSFTPESDDQ